ncbi:MAG: hypothetical protein K2M63_05215 [Muribaculaceae bacterium]|nr:hypothetical protein [Muribaculaceae bacterium]
MVLGFILLCCLIVVKIIIDQLKKNSKQNSANKEAQREIANRQRSIEYFEKVRQNNSLETKPAVPEKKIITYAEPRAMEKTEPAIERFEPAMDKTESAIDTTKPVIDKTESAIDKTKPVIDKTKPTIKPTTKRNEKPDNKLSIEEKPDKKTEQSAKEKGNDFEEVLANMFRKNKIRILEWNQGTVTKAGAMGENALRPDFFLSQEINGKPVQYWVEAKYRSKIGEFFFLQDYQFERYKKHQRESKRKIIIAIGVGGIPSSPHSFYFVPLDILEDGKVSRDVMKTYFLSNPVRDFPGRMERWFLNEVFKKK